jgi:hypothetical protein
LQISDCVATVANGALQKLDCNVPLDFQLFRVGGDIVTSVIVTAGRKHSERGGREGGGGETGWERMTQEAREEATKEEVSSLLKNHAFKRRDGVI